ncbi:cation:proton antiporter [Spiractinospora alimapuensis]|uniref:monovalent cation/H+ antiporter complex subunit F n=1 Tax=Spiractinospora alimapuensis TaxID=2820884 RepID=UPI001F363B41|nr:monovalent cation/H+ antiporter complex subunit F [Spiractinospora alimapuensis]QVQ53539.1 cation:proton antiporter [Spiractinospora alimapuensis]
MTVVYVIVAVLLSTAAALTMVRLVRGPSALDRATALDTLIAVMICGIGAEAVAHGRTTTLPILLVLAIIGFTGSVAISRFAPSLYNRTAESAKRKGGQR